MIIGGRINENSRLFWERFLDLVFPRTCVQCGRLSHGVGEVFTCRQCRKAYHFIKRPVCDRCGAPVYGVTRDLPRCDKCRDLPAGFSHARSLFRYSGTGARLIHALKYERGIWLQREITSLLLHSSGWDAYFRESVLVPVPLHAGRLHQRGYNQAEIVARAISAAFPGICIENCLRRTRITRSQTLLSRKDRFRNMRDAFTCSGTAPEGSLVLIDDVLTTGATLNAAARALIDVGGRNISAFTLAHG